MNADITTVLNLTSFYLSSPDCDLHFLTTAAARAGFLLRGKELSESLYILLAIKWPPSAPSQRSGFFFFFFDCVRIDEHGFIGDNKLRLQT